MIRRTYRFVRSLPSRLMDVLGRTQITGFVILATRYAYRSYGRHRSRRPLSTLDRETRQIYDDIAENGYAILPEFYDSKTCAALRKEIDGLLDKYPNFVHRQSDLRIFGAENLSKQIRNFSDTKVGYDLVNAYWSTPARTAFTLAAKLPYSAENKGSGEGWHRDSFFCQFKVIVYLTDVTVENGPFQYIRYSHKIHNVLQDISVANLRYNDTRIPESKIEKILLRDTSRLVTFDAPCGTAIIADTSGLHRGMPIRSGVRYALTNYYYPDGLRGPWMREKFNLVPEQQTVPAIEA